MTNTTAEQAAVSRIRSENQAANQNVVQQTNQQRAQQASSSGAGSSAPPKIVSSISNRVLTEQENIAMIKAPVGSVVDVPRAVTSGSTGGYIVNIPDKETQYFINEAQANQVIRDYNKQQASQQSKVQEMGMVPTKTLEMATGFYKPYLESKGFTVQEPPKVIRNENDYTWQESRGDMPLSLSTLPLHLQRFDRDAAKFISPWLPSKIETAKMREDNLIGRSLVAGAIDEFRERPTVTIATGGIGIGLGLMTAGLPAAASATIPYASKVPIIGSYITPLNVAGVGMLAYFGYSAHKEITAPVFKGMGEPTLTGTEIITKDGLDTKTSTFAQYPEYRQPTIEEMSYRTGKFVPGTLAMIGGGYAGGYIGQLSKESLIGTVQGAKTSLMGETGQLYSATELEGFTGRQAIFQNELIISEYKPILKTEYHRYEVPPEINSEALRPGRSYDVTFNSKVESGGLDIIEGRGAFSYKANEPVIFINPAEGAPTTRMLDIGKLTPSELKFTTSIKWGESELTEQNINIRINKPLKPETEMEQFLKDTTASAFPAGNRFSRQRLVEPEQIYEPVVTPESFYTDVNKIVVPRMITPSMVFGGVPIKTRFDYQPGTMMAVKESSILSTLTTPKEAIGTPQITFVTPREIQLTPTIEIITPITEQKYIQSYKQVYNTDLMPDKVGVNEWKFPGLPMPSSGGGGGRRQRRSGSIFKTVRINPIMSPGEDIIIWDSKPKRKHAKSKTKSKRSHKR